MFGWGPAGIVSHFCSNGDPSGNKCWPPASCQSKTSQLKRGWAGLGWVHWVLKAWGSAPYSRETLGVTASGNPKDRSQSSFCASFSGDQEPGNCSIHQFLDSSCCVLLNSWGSVLLSIGLPAILDVTIHPFTHPSKVYWKLEIQDLARSFSQANHSCWSLCATWTFSQLLTLSVSSSRSQPHPTALTRARLAVVDSYCFTHAQNPFPFFLLWQMILVGLLIIVSYLQSCLVSLETMVDPRGEHKTQAGPIRSFPEFF